MVLSFHLSLSCSNSSAALSQGEIHRKRQLLESGCAVSKLASSGREHLAQNIFALMEGGIGYFLLSLTPNGKECVMPERGWAGCMCQGDGARVAVLPAWLAAFLQHQGSQSCSTLARRIPLSWPSAATQMGRSAGGQGTAHHPPSCHAAKPHTQRCQQ